MTNNSSNWLEKFTVIMLALLFMSSCHNVTNTQQTNESLASGSYIYSDILKKQHPTIDPTEYIARIGKKLILVSNKPEADYTFTLQNITNPIETTSQGSINLDLKAMRSLDDEAELAYVLACAITNINNNYNYIHTSAAAEDLAIMKILAMADYDPQAMVDLQRKYLNNPYHQDNAWIAKLSKYAISPQRIEYNAKYIAKNYHGLQRNKNRFINTFLHNTQP